MAAAVQGWPGAVVGLLAAPLRLVDLDERSQGAVLIGGAFGMIALDWWVAGAVFGRQSLGMAVAGIVVAVVLAREDGRSIGDLVAGTRVVEAR